MGTEDNAEKTNRPQQGPLPLPPVQRIKADVRPEPTRSSLPMHVQKYTKSCGVLFIPSVNQLDALCVDV